MKLENDLRAIDIRLVAISVPKQGGTHFRLETLITTGQVYTIKRWTAPTGAPTPSQLEDIMAEVMNEVREAILTRFGCQGALA